MKQDFMQECYSRFVTPEAARKAEPEVTPEAARKTERKKAFHAIRDHGCKGI